MSDADSALAAPLRKKIDRIQHQMNELKEQLGDQRAEENAAESDFDILQEVQEQIEIYKEEYSQLSDSLYESNRHQRR